MGVACSTTESGWFSQSTGLASVRSRSPGSVSYAHTHILIPENSNSVVKVLPDSECNLCLLFTTMYMYLPFKSHPMHFSEYHIVILPTYIRILAGWPSVRVAIEEEDLELERRRERVVVDNCQMRVCGDRWVDAREGEGAKVKHLKGKSGSQFLSYTLTHSQCRVSGTDCGEEAASWLTALLGRDCRLVRQSTHSLRKAKKQTGDLVYYCIFNIQSCDLVYYCIYNIQTCDHPNL